MRFRNWWIAGGVSIAAGLFVHAASPAAEPDAVVEIVHVSTNRQYLLDHARIGAKVHSDRDYSLRRLPEALHGKLLLRTANDDDMVAAAEHLQLRLPDAATLYVCYDIRAQRPAHWLTGWELVEGRAATNDTAYRIYRRRFEAGTLTLGGNQRRSTGALGNYFVIAAPGKQFDDGLKAVRVVAEKDVAMAPSPSDQPAGSAAADSDLPRVPPGFKVRLFAREPLIHNPAAMCFDAHGRLLVGHGPQYRNPRPDTRGDSVVILIDDDDDGRADRAKEFATGFNSIQGLAWRGDQLWVANAPELTAVRDTDGDDVADEYVRVYTDLGNLEHGLHGLNWAPDGKLYMSKGNSKGRNRPDETGRVAPRPFRELFGLENPQGAADFPAVQSFSREEYARRGKGYHDPADDWGRQGGILRCDLGGENLQIVSRGFRNPWDIAFDDGFDWLGTDNDQDQGDKIFAPFYGAHFGWGHSWSYDWHGADHLPTVPASGPLFEGSGTGVVYYTASQFPPAYRNVFFVNDWLSQKTYVYRPSWNGALREPADPARPLEPFVTAGGLYKPTDIEVGPDGALYVCGWGVQYGVDWVGGRHNGVQDNAGRVFRIAYDGHPLPPRRQWHTPKRDLPHAEWAFEQLVDDLRHEALPIWRVNAQDELVRRGKHVTAQLMATLEQEGRSRGQQTWMAWTLGRVSPRDRAIDEFFARLAAGKRSRPTANGSFEYGYNLRIQALRILAHRRRATGSDEPLPAAVAAALGDAEPRLRFAAVQAIWQTGDRSRLEALKTLAAKEQDRVTFYTVWNALRELASVDQRKALLTDSRPGVQLAALLGLADDYAVTKDEVLRLVESDASPRVQQWGLKWVLGGEPPRPLGNAPQRLGSSDSISTGELIRRLEQSPSGPLRLALLRLLEQKRISGSDWSRTLQIHEQRADAEQHAADAEETACFLRALAYDSRSRPLLWKALASDDESLRLVAIDALARRQPGSGDEALKFVAQQMATADDPRQLAGGVRVLNRLRGEQSPGLEPALISRLVNLFAPSDDPRLRCDILQLLVAARPADLAASDELRAQVLGLAHDAAASADPRVWSRAAPLAARLGETLNVPPRQPPTAQEVLRLLASADASRGKAHFFDAHRANCGACHQVAGRGSNLAPGLGDIATRARPEEILDSILHPSRKITEGFAVTRLITTDGRTISGAVRAETDAAVLLLQADGTTVEVPRSEIDERALSDQSLMPANLGLILATDELADLIAWLALQKDTHPTAGKEAAAASTEVQSSDTAPPVTFATEKGHVTIAVGKQPLATYYYADEKITRPHFAHVHAPGSIQVTRNHPPKKDDPQDHADFHPGIFLAFGDISGNDYWRLAAKVVHDGFVEQPHGKPGWGSFTVRNRYLSADGKSTVCIERCRWEFHVRPEGYLIVCSSEFQSPDADFYFGDQEEMGLGARLAAGLRENGGHGRILSSEGQTTAARTWGKAAAWCDYSGQIDGRWAGITIMPSPDNLRASWWHNRDYGLFAANLFGRQAMRQGAASKIVVRRGEVFQLGYGILLHAAADEKSVDVARAYRDYGKLAAQKVKAAP